MPVLHVAWKYRNVKVEVVSTKSSLAFFDAAAVAGARVWRDEDEWTEDVSAHVQGVIGIAY